MTKNYRKTADTPKDICALITKQIIRMRLILQSPDFN